MSEGSLYTGCLSKNLTLRILTVKKHFKKQGLNSLIVHFKMFIFLTLFNFVLVMRQLLLEYE